MFEKTDQDKFNRADEETAHCGVHGRQKPGNLHFGEVAFSLNDWFVTARLLSGSIQHMTSVRVSLRNCDTCCDTEVNRVVSFVREKKKMELEGHEMALLFLHYFLECIVKRQRH